MGLMLSDSRIALVKRLKNGRFADLRDSWHIAPLILRGDMCCASRIDEAMVKSVPDMGWATVSDIRSKNLNARKIIS